MSLLSKTRYRLNAVSIKIPMAFFHRNGANDFKISMEQQET